MSFVGTFNQLDLEGWVDRIESTSVAEVDRVLATSATGAEALGVLISSAAGERLERLSQRSQQITQQRLGR